MVIKSFSEVRKKRIFKYAMCILISLSASFYSMQQIIVGKYSIEFLIFTGLVSFCVTTYVYITSFDLMIEIINSSRWRCLVLCVFSILIVYTGYQTKGYINYGQGFKLPINIFRKRYYLLSIVAVEFYLILLYYDIKKFLSDLFSHVKNRIKKIYAVVSIISSCSVLFVYFLNDMWYQMFDHVYGIDCDWVYEIIYKDINYYDIRHPFLGVMTFPIYSIIEPILISLVPHNISDMLLAYFIQIFHIQCILLIGIMIYVMSKNNLYSMVLFWLSFPSLLFIFAFEKYQISIFLVVMYTYLYYNDQNRSLISALMVGAMPTNGAILMAELFGKKTIAEKIKNCLRVIISGCAISILTGRYFILNLPNTFYEARTMHSTFGSGELSVRERCYAFLNMIRGCFVGLTSVEGNSYTWENVSAEPDVVVMLIVGLMVVGFFVSRKTVLAKICVLELIEAFVLIVVLNFSPYEAPTYSIFFSWAFVILLVEGIDFVYEHIRIDKKIAWRIILAVIFIINITMICSIDRFLKTRGPEEVVLPIKESSVLLLNP